MSKRWVYESHGGHECNVVLKKTTKRPIDDGRGGVLDFVTSPAIYLYFIIPGSGGPARAVIDETFALRHDYPIESLVALADAKIKLGGGFFLVQGPDTKEAPLEAPKSSAGAGPKVKHGVRNTSDK